MAFYGLIMLAALPFVSNPWGQAALIFCGGACFVFWLKDGIDQLGANQKEIYKTLSYKVHK